MHYFRMYAKYRSSSFYPVPFQTNLVSMFLHHCCFSILYVTVENDFIYLYIYAVDFNLTVADDLDHANEIESETGKVYEQLRNRSQSR